MSAPSSPLTPYRLRTEYLTEPLGLGERRPRLSWALRSAENDQAQTAYRVRVTAPGGAVAWDTGWRDGDAGSAEYGGAPLASTTRYAWTVALRDARGAETAPVSAAFETGPLNPADWQASWIERPPGGPIPHDPPSLPASGEEGPTSPAPAQPPADGPDRTRRTRGLPPACQFRRSFALGGGAPVARARVHVTAHGLYRLHLNGARVGADELTPGWTEYRERVQYQTYDVTGLLRDGGENVLAATVAEGWWSGYFGMNARKPALHYGDRPQLLLQLEIDREDGTRTTVATDGEWREHPGAIRYADLLMGQETDARRATAGWTDPGFDDSGWRPAAVAGDDVSTLTASADAPVRVRDEVPAREVVRRPEGFVVDLGRNLVGRVRLTVRGAKRGHRVRLRHAEVLDADGALYTENLRGAEAVDTYRAGGAETEVFEPEFTTHGFRYVLVSGYPGELRPEDVTGVVVHSDTERTGEFSCSDDSVNTLAANIWWGQRGNFVSVPTDCPQRDERLGWLADAQVFLPTAALNADVAAFFTRWLRDVRSGQDADGAFRDVAPVLNLDKPAAPSWGDAGVVIPWHLWRVYGDERLLRDSLPSMRAWIDHVHRANPDLIWRHATGNHYGDWLQVDAATPRDVLATAQFAHSTALLARAAEALGEERDAARYGELAVQIREAFRDAFVAPDTGRIEGDTQTCYLMALAWQLLPEKLQGPAAQRLAELIEARGNRLTTGFVGVALLCPVLDAVGRADLAHALLTQREYPSWLYSVDRGATTIWERWDGWTEDRGFQSPQMNSFNHYSLGSVGEWLYRGVAGIDQAEDSVAYRRLVIRPRIGGLDWAKGAFESMRGRIAVSWERDADGACTVTAEVPPGSRATVHVPGGEVHEVGAGRHVLR